MPPGVAIPTRNGVIPIVKQFRVFAGALDAFTMMEFWPGSDIIIPQYVDGSVEMTHRSISEKLKCPLVYFSLWQ
jgi:hypothetical protein